MENATTFLFEIAILIFSVVIHEVSHGFAALALGDRTAQYAGRLTLNPIKHIDPIGSLLLPAISLLFNGPLIGWAKPVPYNPFNLRNQKWGPLLVGIAGPFSNFFLALMFGIFFRVMSANGGNGLYAANFSQFLLLIIVVNLSLFVFNLLPIPPLDGSKIISAIIPYQWEATWRSFEYYGMFIILGLVFLAPGLLYRVIAPVISTVFSLLTGTSLF